MLLMIPALLAVCAKAYYLFTFGAQLLAPTSYGFLFDNVMQMVLMLALAAYAFTAGKR
jgi:hypothetical protein